MIKAKWINEIKHSPNVKKTNKEIINNCIKVNLAKFKNIPLNLFSRNIQIGKTCKEIISPINNKIFLPKSKIFLIHQRTFTKGLKTYMKEKCNILTKFIHINSFKNSFVHPKDKFNSLHKSFMDMSNNNLKYEKLINKNHLCFLKKL